jgi:hypothetical protein
VGLSLNRLKALFPALASRLSNLNGELFLNGVTELSMEAISHLSKLDGSLALDGLNSLADGSLRLLFAKQGLVVAQLFGQTVCWCGRRLPGHVVIHSRDITKKLTADGAWDGHTGSPEPNPWRKGSNWNYSGCSQLKNPPRAATLVSDVPGGVAEGVIACVWPYTTSKTCSIAPR